MQGWVMEAPHPPPGRTSRPRSGARCSSIAAYRRSAGRSPVLPEPPPSGQVAAGQS